MRDKVAENARGGFKRWQDYMQFKGPFEALFRFHLPLVAVFIFIVCLAFTFISLNKHALLACFGVNLCLWLAGFLFLRLGFIAKKDGYLRRFGRKAYKVAAFRYLLPYGVFWLSAVTMPLWVPGKRALELFPFSLLGLAVVITGLFLMHKILAVFGMDRLIYLYTYYPQEASLVKLKIFEFIRHPAYTAWIFFGAGFFLIRGSLTSLMCLAINFLAISLLVRAEEGDIIKDFQEDYRAYKNSVPCFFPRRPFAFFAFLFK